MKEIPKNVHARLLKYFRILTRYRSRGVERVRSEQIASELYYDTAIDASTVRRDLSYLGNNGLQGYGYLVSDLIRELAAIFGLEKQEEMILIGVGHMGTALLKYNNFNNSIGHIVCGFDLKPEHTVAGIPIYHIDDLALYYRPSYRIAIITIPSVPAQKIAEQLVAMGVRVIINYSDDNIVIKSRRVKVQNIDLNVFIQEAIYSLHLK